VNRWYRFIPMCIKSFYDYEDMVNDVILHLRRRQHCYSPEKAQLSTWVYQVSHHYCRDIVQRYQRAKRNAEMVEIDDPETPFQIGQESFLRQRQAFNAVERVIEFGSDAVKDLVEALLSGQATRERDLPEHAREAIGELQKVAKNVHANVEDFVLVFRHAL